MPTQAAYVEPATGSSQTTDACRADRVFFCCAFPNSVPLFARLVQPLHLSRDQKRIVTGDCPAADSLLIPGFNDFIVM
jgi:hypothetical protein